MVKDISIQIENFDYEYYNSIEKIKENINIPIYSENNPQNDDDFVKLKKVIDLIKQWVNDIDIKENISHKWYELYYMKYNNVILLIDKLKDLTDESDNEIFKDIINILEKNKEYYTNTEGIKTMMPNAILARLVCLYLCISISKNTLNTSDPLDAINYFKGIESVGLSELSPDITEDLIPLLKLWKMKPVLLA